MNNQFFGNMIPNRIQFPSPPISNLHLLGLLLNPNPIIPQPIIYPIPTYLGLPQTTPSYMLASQLLLLYNQQQNNTNILSMPLVKIPRRNSIDAANPKNLANVSEKSHEIRKNSADAKNVGDDEKFTISKPIQLEDVAMMRNNVDQDTSIQGENNGHLDSNILERSKRSQKIKKFNLCDHQNEEHYAKNLCYNCYHKYGRLKKPWNCPHEVLYARGLCQDCYIVQYYKKRKRFGTRSRKAIIKGRKAQRAKVLKRARLAEEQALIETKKGENQNKTLQQQIFGHKEQFLVQ